MSRNASGRRTPERLTADQRRRAAMEATLQLLSMVPYEDILVEDIAAAAGMSRPLLYHYFGGKEQVTAAALRWSGHLMLEEIHHASTTAGGRWLEAGVEAYLDYITTRTTWYTMFIRHAYLPGNEMESVRREVRLRIFGGLHVRLAPNGGSPVLRSLIWGWVGQVESICREWLVHREPRREVLEPLLCDLLPAALRTGAGLDDATDNAWRLLTEA